MNFISDSHIKHGNQPLKYLTRYTIGKKIHDLSNQQFIEIKDAMAKAKFICTTADIWSGSNRRFLGVTVHWVIFYREYSNKLTFIV